jgi:short-subunit dehydrogenase
LDYDGFLNMGESVQLLNKVALVTGASAGIGRAYCEFLAARGAIIVAVARRADRLLELQVALANRYQTRVLAIPCDLSDSNACSVIRAALDVAGLEIDVLVNNAGYGLPGKFLMSEWQSHRDFEQVMIGSVSQLCYEFLPSMIARRQGVIINVASIAGFLPGTSGHTAYAAVKAWLINFSESLAFEYENDGVRVCAVCPGFTYSEFHDVTGTRNLVAALPAVMWMTAESVVEQSVDALSRGHIVFIPGLVNRMIVRAVRWMPRRLSYWLVRRESQRFRNLAK